MLVSFLSHSNNLHLRAVANINVKQAYNTVGFGIKFEQIWIALLDPKAWAFAVINAGLGLGISSVGLFLPTFIKALGFSVGM